MKQKTKKVICAIAWLLFTSSFCFAINDYRAEQMSGRTILIIPRPPLPGGSAPRSQAYNPFYAELTEYGVLLAADSDWGNATVTLSSLEGDYYQTTFDMEDGSILLPISGDAGDSYTLSIAIGELEYEGEFYL